VKLIELALNGGKFQVNFMCAGFVFEDLLKFLHGHLI
jgi:hypothetical protein